MEVSINSLSKQNIKKNIWENIGHLPHFPCTHLGWSRNLMTLLVHVYCWITKALVDPQTSCGRASTQHTLRVVGQFLGAKKESRPRQKMEVQVDMAFLIQSLLQMVLARGLNGCRSTPSLLTGYLEHWALVISLRYSLVTFQQTWDYKSH